MGQNGEDIQYWKSILLEVLESTNCEKQLEKVLLDIKESHYWETLKEQSYCNDNLKKHFDSLVETERVKFFRFAITCISTFVQANFTGPPVDVETNDFLCNNEILENVDYKNLLSVNNEEINLNTKYPCLLIASQLVFKNCILMPTINLLWQWRGLLIHQRILDDVCPVILSEAENLESQIHDLHLTGNLGVLMNIEQAQLFCKFRHTAKADEYIKAAANSLGLKYELIGKLGKKAKLQPKDLWLKVELEQSEAPRGVFVTENEGPKNVALNDAVRLETADKNESPELTDLEQKVLLLVVLHTILSKPHDQLYFEELRPFLDTVLSQKNTWCVSAFTLQLRCNLEVKESRTIERCLMQCEEVLNSVKNENPHVLRRISGCYNTSLSPIWLLEEIYANMMLNMGFTNASLEIYKRLHLWEEIIICYTVLKMKPKVIEIIKKELEISPTVKLYCLFGDLTEDVSCYDKAWELSKSCSYRAQRHWGLYYFAKKNYAECIPHFEKSVSLNPLQGVVWLRLGFAALETQNWEAAVTAYHKYTDLEPDAFEAWNNLAQAYIKLGDKISAHDALKEALRCNYDNWKVWENYLVVSADIDCYSDLIRSYHKVLDLKGKYTNINILKVLVHGVCGENNAEDYDALTKKTRELMARVTSIFPDDGNLWELYARLAPVITLKIQMFQRALKAFTRGNWNCDIEVCKQVLDVCLQLGEAVLDDSFSTKDIINSVKLSMNSVIPLVNGIDNSEIVELLQEVINVVTRLTEKCNS